MPTRLAVLIVVFLTLLAVCIFAYLSNSMITCDNLTDNEIYVLVNTRIKDYNGDNLDPNDRKKYSVVRIKRNADALGISTDATVLFDGRKMTLTIYDDCESKCFLK